jgi:glycosyltransferase involved in cell wall biosynthesis
LLESLARQTCPPERVVIVGDGEGNAGIALDFPQLGAEFLPLPGASVSEKRNRGAEAVRPGIDFIAFIDDDMVLEATALEAVMGFWEAAPPDLGGACPNMVGEAPRSASWLKKKIAPRLALYSSQKGAVARSGFHVPFGEVAETTYVSWLPTGCVVYSRRVFEKYRFDEFFKGYSYLEDLDLSYRVGKDFRLAVVASARCYHLPTQIGRPHPFLFGRKEVVNRLHFVSKHRELSRLLCLVTLCLRALMSVGESLSHLDADPLKRAAGNVAGLLRTSSRGARPV